MLIKRNVAFGQFKGCIYFHVGATALLLPWLKGDRSWGIEVATPRRWFAMRPFRSLTVER